MLEQTSIPKTISKTLPAKIQIQNITNQRNPFKGSFKPLIHSQPNHFHDHKALSAKVGLPLHPTSLD